jgi:hypothetical protein
MSMRPSEIIFTVAEALEGGFVARLATRCSPRRMISKRYAMPYPVRSAVIPTMPTGLR